MDINQIDETIHELESQNATFDSCNKLASLYIVRENLYKSRQNSDEIHSIDVLPGYANYVENKRKYQLKQIPEDCLHSGMNLLCLEISDFIHSLYSSCDTELEKTELKNVISSLNSFLL